MKQKSFSMRCALPVLGIFFALCIALGLHFAAPKLVYAEEGTADNNPISIEGGALSLSAYEFTYSGSAIEPEVAVSLDGTALAPENYSVAYFNNVNAGPATVSVTGKGDYTGTLTQSFTVKKAEDNAWESDKIDVPGWKYGSYSAEAHVFAAKAKYGSDDVKFTVYDSTNAIVTDLSKADAGTYKVIAQLVGNDNYNGLEKTLEGSLTVHKEKNDWDQVPKVIEWEYERYNKNTNLILASAAYGDVKFTIKDAQGSVLVKDFSAPLGVVSGTTESVLSGLEHGDYTLTAYVNGGVNYEDLELGPIGFTVKQTSNDWTVYPDVVQWQYGSYDANINLFLASVNYGTVSFIVKTAEDGEALTPEFTVTDGIINDDENGTIAAKLAGLNSGTYYVYAQVTVDDGNRAQVVARGKEFTVNMAANGWKASPNVISWQYGKFDASVNMVIGTPFYGYAEFSISDNKYDLTGKFTTANGVIKDKDGKIAEVLSNLRAGTYYLNSFVSADENGNYAAIGNTDPLVFNVLQAVNSWTETPSIESWVKGKYSAEDNKISVAAAYGDVDYVIYDTTNEENVVYQVKDGEVIVDTLAKAGVGFYTLKATVEETADYSYIEKTFTFSVFAPEGLHWWAIMLIVLGALAVVALVLFILHQKGVLQMFTSKFVIAMRTKMTVDATIAAIRANKVAEAAKRSVAAAEAEEAAKKEQDNGGDASDD